MEDNKILLKEIDDIKEELSEKLDSHTFFWFSSALITILLIFSGSILNLYVLYYSGLSDIKERMVRMETKVESIDRVLQASEIQIIK